MNTLFKNFSKLVLTFVLVAANNFVRSFAPGTVVLTSDGYVPMNKLAGRQLLVSDSGTVLVTNCKQVEAVEKMVIRFVGGDQSVECAPTVFFYNLDTQQSIQARHLQPGDRLKTRTGAPVVVEAIELIGCFEQHVQPLVTFPHTFFISQQELLVYYQQTALDMSFGIELSMPKEPEGFFSQLVATASQAVQNVLEKVAFWRSW